MQGGEQRDELAGGGSAVSNTSDEPFQVTNGAQSIPRGRTDGGSTHQGGDDLLAPLDLREVLQGLRDESPQSPGAHCRPGEIEDAEEAAA